MTDPIDPVRGPSRPRSVGRRAVDRAGSPVAHDETPNLPVPVGEVTRHAPEEAPPGDAGVTAQLLAGAPKRGLKGGPETLEKARASYLGTEYSGDNDRRPKAGIIRKTEI